ncbi:dihydrodipicolinate reductase [Bacillus coahuilensis p1.1.43]|uniref:4-hydroxy-tetrahydrodipicolinate reductase n=1 Tax=Bacillus coahuilensis p1.1.43 TaxID=1150625 RepID=A0A147K8U7_9BACI|nr:4-hydroxy-tetrahydrodipicolinate reductase [Bacillus coahuilensis]KUP06557.1 dihydrodipicolinate reductase [Bacillus coahuilensis p1.1.43]
MSKIKVAIAGPRGRMGQEAVKMVLETDQFELVGALDHRHDGKLLQDILPGVKDEIPIYGDIKSLLSSLTIDVLVDLTTPDVGYLHTKEAIMHGVRPVVGTTGFTQDQLSELRELAEEKGIGVIIAPNFAIGAILMMKFAQMASKYLPDVEIIEMHHDQKLDAPSGTAIKTAEMIQQVRESKQQGHPDEKEIVTGARGGDLDGIHIHSVRLKGLVAHQQVMLGGEGQLLTLKHDSFNRASFMSGVKMCVETIMNLDTLVYGLENLID